MIRLKILLKLNDLVQKINIKYMKEVLMLLSENVDFIEKCCNNYKAIAQ